MRSVRTPHSVRFASVVLDMDSTISGLEGIDWLASERGADVAATVRELTQEAMEGRMELEQVYAARLNVIRPSRNDIAVLGSRYLTERAPGAENALSVMRDAGVRVVVVSGGLRPALLPLAELLGVEASDVHAVELSFGSDGEYVGFDTTSPLATQTGKKDVVASLNLPRKSLMVGDGSTDLAARDAVDAFAAFTGFVRREAVAARADFVVSSFDELLEIVLAGPA